MYMYSYKNVRRQEIERVSVVPGVVSLGAGGFSQESVVIEGWHSYDRRRRRVCLVPPDSE